MTKRTPTMLFAVCIAIMLNTAVFASTIALRSAVRLPADATVVRLGDIAELSGPDAEALAGVIIEKLIDPAAAVQIPLRQVRERLDEAGVHWGRVSLSGRTVTVRPRRTGASSPPLPMSEAAIDGARLEHRKHESTRAQHQPVSQIMGQGTVRSMIAAYVANGLNVSPHDLQLSFDERNAAFLDAMPGQQQFEIEPVSNLRSNRIDLTVRVWVDGLIDHRRTVSVSPLVRRPVVIVSEEIRRDQVIDEASLSIEQRWLAPNQSGLVHDTAAVAGRHALVRLREGEALRETHLRRETLIRRGEQVVVRCVVGSAVITLQAEARADGSEGDTIEFRKIGERDTFLATVTGRNEAILDLSKRQAS